MARPILAALDGTPGLEHGITSAPKDEARLAEDAIRRGFRTLVAVGGDGTWGNVADAIVRSGLPVRLGLVPAGTGSDFAKSVGIPIRGSGRVRGDPPCRRGPTRRRGAHREQVLPERGRLRL